MALASSEDKLPVVLSPGSSLQCFIKVIITEEELVGASDGVELQVELALQAGQGICRQPSKAAEGSFVRSCNGKVGTASDLR
jgi:hypothetical protein